MPMDRSRYPDNWEAISLAIRERAGNRCEWCGVENGAVGARDKHGDWHDENMIEGMNSDVGFALFGDFPKIIRIVLTVAHLGTEKPDGSPGDKHDKMDCRPENLAALCQKCHLDYDREDHIAAAYETRRQRKVEAGQMELGLSPVVATGSRRLVNPMRATDQLDLDCWWSGR